MATKQIEVTKQDELMKKLGYSDRAIKYYKKKLNFKELPLASVKGEETGFCGDYMSVSLKVNKKGIITDAVFEALGCAGACVSGSSLTILVKGKTLKEAEKLTYKDIVKHLGEFPKNKIECAQLAVKALKNAIKKYKNK